MSHCRLWGYFQTQSNNKQEDPRKCPWQTHPDIWECLEPAEHKPSLPDENTAPISQENQLSGVVSRGKAMATSRDGRRWHHWISRWQAKQHQCTISSASKKNQTHLGVTGEKSAAKTYVLPEHLKPKYWLIQSCFKCSHQQCIALLWV